jgi:hypothetical protein
MDGFSGVGKLSFKHHAKRLGKKRPNDING